MDRAAVPGIFDMYFILNNHQEAVMKLKVLGFIILSIFLVSCSGQSVKVKPFTDVKSDDYLAPGVKIAAIQMVSWEDTAFMAKAYPVRIITEASISGSSVFVG